MQGGRLIPIDDPADPRIAGFTSIRERDLTRQQGMFVAEGTVVLTMLAVAHRKGSDFSAIGLLLLENRVEGLSALIDQFPENVPVYVATKAVMNAIAGFDIHRGVLALGQRNQASDSTAIIAGLPAKSLVIAACGISNHDNIGSIFRNAAAFGADAILLDETCCDPLYRKALRVSVGSVLSVPYARGGTVESMIAGLQRAGFDVWGLSPRGETDIRHLPSGNRMALLTGTEGEGLDRDILRVIRTARIPQAPGLDSLNAATATGIALFALASGMARI